MNGPGTLNGSRLPPNPPGVNRNPSYDTALKGASLAFQKTTPKQPSTPSPSSRHADTRAIIAAASATSASRDHSRTVSQQTTGGSNNHDIEHGIKSQHLTQRLQPLANRSYGTPSHSYLAPGNKQTIVDPHSPSFIAASLAASRNASPIRPQTMQSHQHAHPPVKARRKHNISANESAASSVTSLDLATDTTSIPSTNALISMFEKKEDYTDPVKKEVKVSDNGKSLGAEVKPRARSPPRALDTIAKDELSPSRLASAVAWERAVSPSASESETTQKMSYQPKKAALDLKRHPPTPPPTRTKHKVNTPTHSETLESKGKLRASTPPPRPTSLADADAVVLPPRLKRPASQKTLLNDVRAQDAIAAKDQKLQSTRRAPEYPAPMNDAPEASTPQNRNYQSSPSSNGSFVSASSTPLSVSDSPIRGRSRPSSPKTIRPRRPTQSRPLSTYSLSTVSGTRPHSLPWQLRHAPASSLSVDSLASAMVASSLASSRVVPSSSPAQTRSLKPPLPPPRMPTPHMRQTLRKPASRSDEEEGSGARSSQHRRRRKRLGKLGGGHKHIHHEGARKRWREEITARERKRYEGVWASNRGLLLVPSPSNSPSRDSRHSHHQPHHQPNHHPHQHHQHHHLPPPPDQNKSSAKEKQKQKQIEWEEEKEQLVANAVARDIWSRSRLPADELAEVWDLVDRRGRGALDRAEFVVGMWLIDQRLRGRKIPRKVGESVWGSARGVRVGSLRGGKK
ncbi:hypothetical protein F4820DRAFT_9502 [Hypoxylon rubiginosum]|uniref:Uncharacterized protein n=1 Tax=Hypoxylon rubiginosum TaxID=110542 RepID=A0ACB9ZC27_9PEZI|nr:hypothetical protein F4820DRAFT_9502 [Hypoxylon rubiginosum]